MWLDSFVPVDGLLSRGLASLLPVLSPLDIDRSKASSYICERCASIDSVVDEEKPARIALALDGTFC
jgi:hypothetical protein